MLAASFPLTVLRFPIAFRTFLLPIHKLSHSTLLALLFITLHTSLRVEGD